MRKQPMFDRQVTRVSPLYDQAYEMLTEMILNNYFKPDEKLTDTGLAEMLGISRTPVREAVRQLAREGLLVGLPNRSVTVFQPTLKDIAEIYSIRSRLEGLAARLACLNPKKESYIHQMTKYLEQSSESTTINDSSDNTKLNTAFHDLIFKAGENHNLMILLESIKNKVIICRMNSLQNQDRVNIALSEHFEIVEKLKGDDATECEETVQEHILQAGLRILEQSGESYDMNDPTFAMFMRKS